MNKSKFSLDIDDIDKMDKIDRISLHNFAKGALNHSTKNIEKDWQQEDPSDPPSYNFRLRLNKYQIGMLKDIANSEKRSISNLIKVILMTELNKRNTKLK